MIFALVFPYLPTKPRRIIAAIIIGFCCAFLGLQLELRWLDFSPSPNVYFVFSVGIGGAVALVLTGVPLGQKALEP